MPRPDLVVTIVIPAYNAAGYLSQAIDSVLAQEYPNVELIVLDDGSRDATRQVLERYGDRFRWESHANIGQAATQTKGWAMGRGEVLAYLSADDRLEPFAVSESVAALQAHPEAVATYCDFTLIDPASRVLRRVRAGDYDYREMLVNGVCLPGPGAFFRRAAYERAGPWDASLRQMSDYDFWLRLGLCGPFLRIPKPLAAFRIHAESQTFAAVSAERAREPVVIVSRLFERADLPADLVPLRARAVANAHLVSAQLHLRAGRPAAAWQAIVEAARLEPRSLFAARAARMLLNALLNRIGHRALWSLRGLSTREQK